MIAKGVDFFSGHNAYPHIVEQVGHLQAPLGQPPRDWLDAGRRVGGTQGMIPVFSARHDGIRSGAPFKQVAEQGGGHVRHIAGDDDRGLPEGAGQGRMETTKGAATRHLVGEISCAGDGTRRGLTADDENVGRDLRKLLDLSLENRPALDEQAAFVATAESGWPVRPRELPRYTSWNRCRLLL